MSEKIRVLITGATGFAGQHLVRALEEEGGPEEFAIFGTTYPDVPPPSGHGLFFLDLRSETDVLKLVNEIRPDWIFHLAAISSVRDSWRMRRETIETNVLGTHNLLEAVRLGAPGARVLFVSSADVYGAATSPTDRLTEDSPIMVNSPYAYSKAAGELMCEFYAKVENLDVVIARPFPHTGPGQTPDYVCSDWARQVVLIERGEVPPVVNVGNLELQRDFCDVRDTVRAYVFLLRKGRRGEVYNVCSGRATTLQEILDFLVGQASTDVPISVEVNETKLRQTDMPIQVGSYSKTSEGIGWLPSIPINQTLRDLLAFWRGRLEETSPC